MRIKTNKNFVVLFILLSGFILSCNNSGNDDSGFVERNETMKLSFKGKNGGKYILVVKGMSDTNEKFEEFGDKECSQIYKYALFDRAAEENSDFPSNLKMEIKNELFVAFNIFAIDFLIALIAIKAPGLRKSYILFYNICIYINMYQFSKAI